MQLVAIICVCLALVLPLAGSSLRLTLEQTLLGMITLLLLSIVLTLLHIGDVLEERFRS